MSIGGVVVNVTADRAALDVTPQAVSHWELHRRKPRAANALAYAKALAAITA